MSQSRWGKVSDSTVPVLLGTLIVAMFYTTTSIHDRMAGMESRLGDRIHRMEKELSDRISRMEKESRGWRPCWRNGYHAAGNRDGGSTGRRTPRPLTTGSGRRPAEPRLRGQ